MADFKPPLRRDSPIYICESCGNTYGTGGEEAWDRAKECFEANAEHIGDGKEGLAVVCDDCFKKFAAWYKQEFGVDLVT